MNRIQAVRRQGQTYCELCKDKRPIIRFGAGRSYVVVCPTDDSHVLSIAQSQFDILLERWRQGEQLFSLEGLIFANTLRVKRRKDPERWDYGEDSRGVIRIGSEWWPGLQKDDKEQK